MKIMLASIPFRIPCFSNILKRNDFWENSWDGSCFSHGRVEEIILLLGKYSGAEVWLVLFAAKLFQKLMLQCANTAAMNAVWKHGVNAGKQTILQCLFIENVNTVGKFLKQPVPQQSTAAKTVWEVPITLIKIQRGKRSNTLPKNVSNALKNINQ